MINRFNTRISNNMQPIVRVAGRMRNSMKRALYNQVHANKIGNEQGLAKKEMEKKLKKYDQYFTFAEPGHFYSPIPELSVSDSKRQNSKSKAIKSYDAINYNDNKQRQLIKEFGKFYKENPIVDNSTKRYTKNNDQFGESDATLLYSFMRKYKPNRIVEVGSGYSSALMMDVNEKFFNNKINLTFIEPYPERLKSVMDKEDKKRYKIIEKKLESVNVNEFRKLKKNDFLFIDSSHVAKLGSDVIYYLFNIFPVLNPGVIIHIHDIFYPFEYPTAWLNQKRYWNEVYFLKAFMQWNNGFEIQLFNSYIQARFPEILLKNLPIVYKVSGAQLWLAKK